MTQTIAISAQSKESAPSIMCYTRAIVDIFAGHLSRSGSTASATPLFDDYDQSMNTGHLIDAVSIERFRNVSALKSNVDTLTGDLKAILIRDGSKKCCCPVSWNRYLRSDTGRMVFQSQQILLRNSPIFSTSQISLS